ncbi:MAG TPA: peptide-methionine (S)-S-oxide reductase MsrA [Patescibacteria group bacterium]|nr:peptide-methionine (S)-S-oxide reductase MsrA [Patescibacteria group bacterium]
MVKEVATVAGGCFWCLEAIFKRLMGVESVISGYSGGSMDNPSYDKVSMGTTNHAEAIQITFDPQVISYQTLLDVFWHLHDPTTLNRQGADVGTQYRSVIFYHNDEQRKIAEASKEELEKSGVYKDPVVTQIVPFEKFFKAEGYHQDYYEKNASSNQYCRIVIDPKITKLYKNYHELIKEDA